MSSYRRWRERFSEAGERLSILELVNFGSLNLRLAGILWDQIAESLGKNDVPTAAAQLRRGLECFFGKACDLLGGSVRYNAGHKWELGDWCPAAMKEYRELIKRAKDAANSWNDRDSIEKLNAREEISGAIFAKSQAEQWSVNANVHYNNWTNFIREDFTPVVEAFKDVCGLFVCEKCDGMLERARTKFSDLSLVCGDVTSLPFRSGTFDAAFSVQVIHHIKDKKAFLDEAYRILKNGACFSIDICSHQQMRTFWLYYYFPKGLDIDLARIPDSSEIVWLLEKSRFCNVNIEISYTDIVREHENPKNYLDKNYRDGQSTFHMLKDEDIELGCERLRQDIKSGAINSIIQYFEEKEERVGGSCIIYGIKGNYKNDLP